MNSSMHLILPDQATNALHICYAQGPEILAQERHLHVPAPLSEAAWVAASCAKTAMRRVVNARFGAGGLGLPRRPQSTECSNQDPKAIWIVVGDDTVERTQALKAQMHRLAGLRGRQLFIRRGQVKWAWQLDWITALTAELCAQCPQRQVVTALDVVEECQGSPVTIAFQLRSMLDAGAKVACTGDDGTIDFRLLVSHLRMLGVTVISVRHRVTRLSRAADVPEIPRRSPAAGIAALGRFPRVCTAALTAYLTSPPIAAERLENRAGSRTQQQGSTTESEAQDVAGYARAYRNNFAIQRLLRERDAM